MENVIKEIKINVPEGYEIDRENSTFECIKFKKIELEFPKWETKNSPLCSYINGKIRFVDFYSNNENELRGFDSLSKLITLRNYIWGISSCC